MIALEFSMLGSADQDPADKPGIAHMAASLLDEGEGLARDHRFSAAQLEHKRVIAGI